MATGPRRLARRLAPAVVALTAACSGGKPEGPPGLGRQVFAGPVRALQPSPDGAALAFLDGCADVKAQFLPPQTARCDLRVAPSAGGPAVRVAAGVTTLPHGVSWSPDGRALLALADYDHASASGTLVLWKDGAARTLADGVTFHGFGPNGALAFVSAGRLSVLGHGWLAVGAPRDRPQRVEGADGVSTFEFVPSGEACVPKGRMTPHYTMVARRSGAAGGELLEVGCYKAVARPIEPGAVGDYRFSRGDFNPRLGYTVQGREGPELKVRDGLTPNGARLLGRRVQSFVFNGNAVAFVADVAPGKQGNLYLALLSERGEPKPALLAREVGEFRWARAAPRLAWLEKYDPRVRAGVVGAGGRGVATRAFAQNVTDFDLSPDGTQVAFLQHTTRGGYSVDLGLARLDGPKDEKPVTVAQGVFGFAFSPDGRWLYYRTRCVRNAEACDLERVPAAGLAPGAKPEPVAQGVKSFEFDPRDPSRLLLGWQRMDLVALDVGVWKDGKLTRVDSAVLPGSARFLGPDSGRLAYAVAHPKRAGVYVAELPR